MASFEKYYYNLSTIRSQVETALPCANHLTVYSSLFKEYDSSNLCWYIPVLPAASAKNPWEKSFPVPMYSNGTQLEFLAKRTYFAPTGSTPGDLWGTYAWSTTSEFYSEIYLLHTSGNSYAICSSIISNSGSYAPNNIIKTITPKTDRIAVFLSGGGGGGSAPWGTSNGAGGGGAGTACLIVDLSRIKEDQGRLYKFMLGAPAGYSDKSFGTTGNSGATSYMYYYSRTGNIKIADARGGAGGSKDGGGGKGGVAHLYEGVDNYVWKIHGISYGASSTHYEHGPGNKGGDGGGTGSFGYDVIWSAYPMYDGKGHYAGDGCKTTRVGGTSGKNISGGGGASYWGNGANGVGKTGAKGARGTNGSGGSGARWTVGGKEGGPGGYSYLRICWTGSIPSAPSAIYPT